MARKDASGVVPTQVKWTEQMRLTLDVLMLDFDFDHATKVDIFCNVFKDHLRRCGNPEVKWSKLY